MIRLAILFDKMGIDTTEVLEAAGTKWNFLKFKPGLVGGHFIGVDPYYQTCIPKGVFRFKTHEQANRHQQDCLVEGMTQTALERS